MKEHGQKGNYTVYVSLEDIFERLQDREELETTSRPMRPRTKRAQRVGSTHPNLLPCLEVYCGMHSYFEA